MQFHPDKNPAPGSEEVFKVITKSFTILSDSDKRRKYDLTGRDDETPTISNHFYERQSRHFHAGQEVDPDELLRHLFGDFVYMNG